jgi:dihydrofolate reductase
MTSTKAEMPPKNPLHLTLIVAATNNLGIGKNGTLPWRLKAEMQYFARVTTRLPPQLASIPKGEMQNAVIMGRKTWESIPKKFRPLKDRLNLVLTSRAEGGERRLVDGAIWVKSLDDALAVLEDLRADGQGKRQEELPKVARAFVIGGANVYKSALELPGGIANRVLLTRVYGGFDCDTFFPVALGGEEGTKLGWQRKSNSELSIYVGEEVAQGTVNEGDTEFEYCLFERGDTGD